MSSETGGQSFDIRGAMPPTEATRESFTDALSSLRPFATTEHTRGIQIRYGVDNDNFVTASCYLLQRYPVISGIKATEPEIESKIKVGLREAGKTYLCVESDTSVNEAYIRNMDEKMKAIVANEDGAWIMEVYNNAKLPEKELVSLSVSHLLDTSPISPVFSTRHIIARSFTNRSTIFGHWDDDERIYQGNTNTRSKLGFKCKPSARDYVYERLEDGTEYLEIQPAYGVVLDTFEAKQLGVENVTDRKLASFTNSLKVAIESGVQIRNY